MATPLDTSLTSGVNDPTKKQPTATAPSAGQGLTQPTQPIPLSGVASPTPVDRAPAPTAAPFTPAATPDPLAFSSGPTLATNTPPITAPAAPVANPYDPANQQTTAAPLLGGDESKINEYWAKQGVGLSGNALGLTPTKYGADNVAQYDPTQMADAQAKIAGGNNADVAAMLSQLTNGAANNNGADISGKAQAFSDQASANDRANDAAAIAAIPGATSPENMAYAAMHGGASPANNPNAAPISLAGNGPSAPPAATGGVSGGRPGEAPATRPTGSVPSPVDDLARMAMGSSPSVGPNAGVGLTPTNPDDSLIGKTITPNNSVDRVKTFQDSLKSTIDNVLDPAFQARQRDTNRYSFGAGRGVSGMNRTAQGDVASDYGRQIKDLTAQGLAGATNGSIDDLYKNLGIAQQQQGFQRDLSNDAYGQAVTSAQLEDALTNSSFGRALSQQGAGYANDPSQIGLILSKIFGDQSSAAGASAAKLFSQMGAQNGAQGNGGNSDLLQYILSQIGGTGTSSPQIPEMTMPGVQTTPGMGY